MTPLLAVSILVSMSILKFMGNGPFWPIMLDFNTGHCKRYWWSTLIYVQNYVNPKNIVSYIRICSWHKHTHLLWYSSFLFIELQILESKLNLAAKVLPPFLVFERRNATVFHSTGDCSFDLSLQNENDCHFSGTNCNLCWVHRGFTCGKWTHNVVSKKWSNFKQNLGFFYSEYNIC